MATVNFFAGCKILHMEALNSLRGEEIEGLGCLTKELGQYKIESLAFTFNNFTCFPTSYFFMLICCVFPPSFSCALSGVGSALLRLCAVCCSQDIS